MKLTHSEKDFISSVFSALNSPNQFCYLLNYVSKEILKSNDSFLEDEIYFYSQEQNKVKYYQRYKIKKKNGRFRQITAPTGKLKHLQSCLNIILQTIYLPHESAFGFIQNVSIIENATQHINKEYVFNIDLKDFFASITADKVALFLQKPPFELKKQSSFKETLSQLIAAIASFKLSKDMPSVLPQGSPLSPILSNIVCQSFDDSLLNLAKRFKVTYSRYADDISFSGDINIFSLKGEFYQHLKEIIEEEGFLINTDKVRLQSKKWRQEVTGLVVNEKVNIRKKYVKELRMWLYLWETYGYDKASEILHRNTTKKTSLYLILNGKLNFLRMIKGDTNSTYLVLQKRLLSLRPVSESKELTAAEFSAKIKALYNDERIPANFRDEELKMWDSDKGKEVRKNLESEKEDTCGYKSKKDLQLSPNEIIKKRREKAINLINQLYAGNSFEDFTKEEQAILIDPKNASLRGTLHEKENSFDRNSLESLIIDSSWIVVGDKVVSRERNAPFTPETLAGISKRMVNSPSGGILSGKDMIDFVNELTWEVKTPKQDEKTIKLGSKAKKVSDDQSFSVGLERGTSFTVIQGSKDGNVLLTIQNHNIVISQEMYNYVNKKLPLLKNIYPLMPFIDFMNIIDEATFLDLKDKKFITFRQSFSETKELLNGQQLTFNKVNETLKSGGNVAEAISETTDSINLVMKDFENDKQLLSVGEEPLPFNFIYTEKGGPFYKEYIEIDGNGDIRGESVEGFAHIFNAIKSSNLWKEGGLRLTNPRIDEKTMEPTYKYPKGVYTIFTRSGQDANTNSVSPFLYLAKLNEQQELSFALDLIDEDMDSDEFNKQAKITITSESGNWVLYPGFIEGNFRLRAYPGRYIKPEVREDLIENDKKAITISLSPKAYEKFKSITNKAEMVKFLNTQKRGEVGTINTITVWKKPKEDETYEDAMLKNSTIVHKIGNVQYRIIPKKIRDIPVKEVSLDEETEVDVVKREYPRQDFETSDFEYIKRKFDGDYIKDGTLQNLEFTPEMYSELVANNEDKDFIEAIEQAVEPGDFQNVYDEFFTESAGFKFNENVIKTNDENTKTPIEGLNERLDAYGDAKVLLSNDFFEGKRPSGRLNAFKSIIDKVSDNLSVIKDLNLDEFDFISEEDKQKLNDLKPLAEELSRINNLTISSSDTRTVAVEKRYAQLSNQLSNDFVSIMNKYVKNQLGKEISSSKPSVTQQPFIETFSEQITEKDNAEQLDKLVLYKELSKRLNVKQNYRVSFVVDENVVNNLTPEQIAKIKKLLADPVLSKNLLYYIEDKIEDLTDPEDIQYMLQIPIMKEVKTDVASFREVFN